MAKLKDQVRGIIEAKGVICSNDLQLEGEFFWQSILHWSGGNNLSRSVLEHMYATGELIIHHKKGVRKYYDLAEKHIPKEILTASEPFPDEFEHQKWRVLRRIGAVGLLWNRPSDAWLHIWGMKAPERNRIFNQLLVEDKIIDIGVEGLDNPFYCRSEDAVLIEKVQQNESFKPRCQLIAPLDNFIWDRKLIKAIFGFDYTWEIYTPVVKRKYGHYVLPFVYSEKFVGRAEIAADKKTETLLVKNVWFEDGVKQTKKLVAALNSCVTRFARFNECKQITRLI